MLWIDIRQLRISSILDSLRLFDRDDFILSPGFSVQPENWMVDWICFLSVRNTQRIGAKFCEI